MSEINWGTEDNLIVTALQLERDSKQLQVVERSKLYMEQLETMRAKESIESQLAGIALDYQSEREQLPLISDDKKVLRNKMLNRISWAFDAGHTIFGAIECDRGWGLQDGLIMHRADQIKEPELLYGSEQDVYSGFRQGWTVGYPSDFSQRKSSTTILQRSINPHSRSVELDIGFVVKNNDEETISYEGLYKIIASKKHNYPAQLQATTKDYKIGGDELLFPMGLLIEATRAIKASSPYPEAPKSLKRQIRKQLRSQKTFRFLWSRKQMS